MYIHTYTRTHAHSHSHLHTYIYSYKARPQQLYLPKRFHSKLAPLPNAGAMGTNKAFIGKYDGRGQSTKVMPVTYFMTCLVFLVMIVYITRQVRRPWL